MSDLRVRSPEEADGVKARDLQTVDGVSFLLVRFPSDEMDKERSAFWIRRLLAESAGVAAEQVHLAKTENGKPYWPDGGIHFSISHSGAYWAAVFRRGSSVGLDLETWKERSRLKRIAERFFAASEREMLRSIVEDAGFVREALTIWTRKEALTKLRGGALLGELSAERPVADSEDAAFSTTAVDESFVLSVAVDRPSS